MRGQYGDSERNSGNPAWGMAKRVMGSEGCILRRGTDSGALHGGVSDGSGVRKVDQRVSQMSRGDPPTRSTRRQCKAWEKPGSGEPTAGIRPRLLSG